MDTKNKNRALVAGYIASVITVTLIAVVTLITFGQLLLRGLISLVADGRINGAYLALIVISGLFVASLKFVYSSWKENATFIVIADNHLEVEPVNRRDAFLREDDFAQ